MNRRNVLLTVFSTLVFGSTLSANDLHSIAKAKAERIKAAMIHPTRRWIDTNLFKFNHVSMYCFYSGSEREELIAKGQRYCSQHSESYSSEEEKELILHYLGFSKESINKLNLEFSNNVTNRY